MNLNVLGCGTIVQEGSGNNCSGYLLDNHLLFDCGPGIWRAIYHQGISMENIDHIFLTHFHVDHTSDLSPILLNRFLLRGMETKPLNIIGPPGLKSWFLKLSALIGDWVDDMPLQLMEIPGNPFEVAGYTIITHPTGHTENSICYRVEKEKKTFFYSGDTDFNESIISLAKSSSLAILEASNTEETKIEGHLTPQLAIKIATRASVGKLLLTHMYPEVYRDHAVNNAADAFEGDIFIAKDGMKISF